MNMNKFLMWGTMVAVWFNILNGYFTDSIYFSTASWGVVAVLTMIQYEDTKVFNNFLMMLVVGQRQLIDQMFNETRQQGHVVEGDEWKHQHGDN